ncbi:hypothetical protein THOG11_80076 [Vibrio harveyi]|nr:hypothetical protein BG259_14265 [Vibrio harveyi]CAH1236985.1 hypothetical protein TH15OA1_90008 [Vibrio harveyi]CAH1580162.1 hypothetical protein THOD03_70076 [Vibrio harveyi]CAH1588949.1 hypothetical protein THOG11_80076 [Vibrio harveyi]
MLSRRQKLTQVLIKFNLVKVKAQQKGKRLTYDVIESPRKFFFPLVTWRHHETRFSNGIFPCY